MEVFLASREEVIGRQGQEIAELSTPVVRLWDGILALPLIGTLDSARTGVVMENLLQAIVDEEAEIAIIDITGVPTVDTLVAQHLLKTVAAARLMGADCIVSGIRPQIAQTMVHLGVELNGHLEGDAGRRLRARPEADWAHGCAPARRLRSAAEAMDRIPILKLGGTLIVTIQVDMHDRLALALEEDLTAMIARTGARGVLIEISALEIVDSFIGRMLVSIAAVSRVLDAETVLAGMRPAVAITLVELGLELTGIQDGPQCRARHGLAEGALGRGRRWVWERP
ncbi:STAS domain-containing protein [Methylobacterium oryzae CBMB20]